MNGHWNSSSYAQHMGENEKHSQFIVYDCQVKSMRLESTRSIEGVVEYNHIRW